MRSERSSLRGHEECGLEGEDGKERGRANAHRAAREKEHRRDRK